MDANSTLPFQEPDCVRHAVCGRNAQAQVDMIGHRMTFHQLDSTLTTQLAQDRPNLSPQPSLEDYSAVCRYDHYMVLALPLTWDRLCQSCIGSSFLPHGAFLEGGAYAIS